MKPTFRVLEGDSAQFVLIMDCEMVSSKHKRTLAAIFKTPTPATIRWKDIENMLIAFNADISEGSGSRVRIKLNDERITLHRPHPNPNTDKGAVVTLRNFLKRTGINP